MCENNCWQAPLWLTNSYLEEVLRKYLKDEQIQIIDVNIKPATSNGDNYASIMSRIKVEFVQHKKSSNIQELTFIMKYSYESDPFVANIMSGYDIYNTEMKMYDKILPQMADILLEIDDNEQLFAKTLKVDYDRSTIIFEDLSVKNFTLADRLKGLDDHHACLVLKKLAKFHAAAALLNQRLNGELETFQRGIFNRHTRAFGCFFEYLIENCANFAKNCPQLDFQLCNWSSLAVDLHYFIYTSLEQKLQLDIHASNKLIQYYHGVLVDVLGKLKYKGYIPTLHELHIQLEEGKILALTAATASQAVMINDQCDDADFHSLIDDDERARKFRNTLYENKRLQHNLKVLLPYFDQIGLLDLQNEY